VSDSFYLPFMIVSNTTGMAHLKIMKLAAIIKSNKIYLC